MQRFMIAIMACALSGCAYQAEPLGVASLDVVTSYSTKLPGKYLLYVEASPMDSTIRPSGVVCSAHSFPIKAADAFATSARKTIENLVESVETVGEPIPLDQIRKLGSRGLIVIRAENLDGEIRAMPGFWQATLNTEVQITASVTVDGPQGRLFGTTVDGRGKGEAEAGFACGGGAISMRASTEKAMKETLRRIGEGIANSERVRSGKTV